MHHFHNSLCAVLWLLSGCIVLLWGRSNLIAEEWRWLDVHDAPGEYAHVRTTVSIGGGGIGFWRVTLVSPSEAPSGRFGARFGRFTPGYSRSDKPHYPARISASESWLDSLGVYRTFYHRRSRMGELHVASLTLPIWLLLLVTITYPATRYVVRVVRQQHAERMALGLCPRCECDVRRARNLSALRQTRHRRT